MGLPSRTGLWVYPFEAQRLGGDLLAVEDWFYI
jgi:hypothetical protein